MSAVQSGKSIKPLKPIPPAAKTVKAAVIARPAAPDSNKSPKVAAIPSPAIEKAQRAAAKIATPPVPTTVPRLGVVDRTESILVNAVKVATKTGLMSLTRDQVATASGISAALITRYFGGMEQLRDAIVDRAVIENNPRILAEALAYKHKGATKVKSKIKEVVVKYLFN